MQVSNSSSPVQKWRLPAQALSSLAILAAAFLMLLNAVLHFDVYGNRNYRQDELFVTHMFSIYSLSSLVQETASDIAPPGWRLLADFWIDTIGQSEEVTRWLSKLTNLFTFALLYQLGKHIGGKRVGLFAIAFLGLYGFASSLMYELRPYPMLIMLTCALHLLFYRWLHKPSGILMIAYSVVGIAVIYTHFFSIFVFPAHALCLLIFQRFERKLWLNSLMMWSFIGASFLAWLLPFIQAITVVMPGGIYYAIPAGWYGILRHYTHTRFQPELLYQLLLLLSLFAPRIARPRTVSHNGGLRFSRPPAVFYPLCLLLSIFIIAYGANAIVSNFSTRNVAMLAPLIALLMALGLRLLPTYAALIALALLYLHAPQNIAVQTENAPYREIVYEMSASYQTDSIVLTEFDWAWRWLLPAAYYLMDFTPDRMSKDRLFHVINATDSAHPPNYPDALVNVHWNFDPTTFSQKLPTHRQLWLLQEGGGNRHRDSLQDWLDSHYAFVRSITWDQEFVTTYRLSEYARVPAHDGLFLTVGENLLLYAWELQDSVTVSPCQAITIESWWQIQNLDSTPYSIGIILADADGDSQLAIANSVPADKFTSDWQTERFYRDHTTLKVPCTIEEGSYDLLLSAKESMSGKPLELAYPAGDTIGTLFYLTTLHVEDI